MSTPAPPPPDRGRPVRAAYLAGLLLVGAAIVAILAALPRGERGSVSALLLVLFVALDVLLIVPVWWEGIRYLRRGPGVTPAQALLALSLFAAASGAIVVFVGVACISLGN